MSLSFLSITLWDILNIFATLVVPFLVVILTAFGKLILNMIRDINELDDTVKHQGRTLYGDPQDAMSSGLSSEVRAMKASIRNMEQMLDEINRKLNDIGPKD